MGSLKLTTASSGSVILSPANTASDVTITVPAVTGTMITTTGGVAPSTAGNVLTSNGSAWVSQALPSGGVTSLNGQTGAITNTDYGAIGSYVIGHSTTFTGGGYYAANQTCAGNTLIGQNNLGGGSSQSLNIRNNGTSVYIPFGTYSLGLTGTWRSMTNFQSPDANEGSTALWVRIS